MIIDCISDLHGHFPVLEGGDLLIVAGDLTAKHALLEHSDALEWLHKQYYKKKVLIAGNHDAFLEKHPNFYSKTNVTYLCDSGTEFEYWEDIPHPASTPYVSIDCLMKEKRVLKIWGSPWSLTFPNINPRCMAFTGTEADLKAKFDLIPDDIDILVTHSPPHGCYLDEKRDGTMLGSVALRDRCWDLKLKLHVFGHIHEGYGRHGNNINASHVNEHYEPVNKPIRIIL